MTLELGKEIWEYVGDETIKDIKVSNMAREFEKIQMKDSKSIKEWSYKLIGIANKAGSLGTDLSNNKLVHKIQVSIPKRYEATIASLENSTSLNSK